MASWQLRLHEIYDAVPPTQYGGPRPEVMGELGGDLGVWCKAGPDGWVLEDRRR